MGKIKRANKILAHDAKARRILADAIAKAYAVCQDEDNNLLHCERIVFSILHDRPGIMKMYLWEILARARFSMRLILTVVSDGEDAFENRINGMVNWGELVVLNGEFHGKGRSYDGSRLTLTLRGEAKYKEYFAVLEKAA